MLTTSAKVHPRQPRGHGYVWREYGVGHFYRQFTIDAPVNADGIRAESAKTRKIEIKGK